MLHWFLEGYIEPDSVVRRVTLEHFPTVVGRKAGLLLAGASDNMSRYHAELMVHDDRLVVRDLGSKNGTFVNRERTASEAVLEPGDVIHFADAEFRVGAATVSDSNEETEAGTLDGVRLPHNFPAGAGEVVRMLEHEAVDVVYQPIVTLASGDRVGQECLTRGRWPSLPAAPAQLLWVAASVGREVEVSELMRRRAVEQISLAGLDGPTFVNIHPAEIESTERLLVQLAELCAASPELQLVLELHEGTITDIPAIDSLRTKLRHLGIALAYDDFGAGQSRLMELTSSPPDYLKFDIDLIRDIDKAPEQRRQMVRLLVDFARDNGITTLAEGISRREEAAMCMALGFDLGQGYFFGEPMPLP